MSQDDEIAERLLEGSPYEQAAVTATRLFPLSLRWKISVAIVTLAYATLLAPGLALRRDVIEQLEPIDQPGDVYLPGLTALVLIGVVSASVAGAGLAGRQRLRARTDITVEQARRALRIEDFLMFFVVQGAVFVGVPTTVVVVGVVSPAAVETLYAVGVPVYRRGASFAVDARLLSAASGLAAVALVGLAQLLERRTT